MTLREKASYIQGLIQGLKLDKNKAENQVLCEIADLVSLLAAEVEDHEAYLDELDDDLDAVETVVYGLDDEEAEDDAYCDGDCDSCDGCDDIDEEEDMRCILCPHCGEKVYFDESIEMENLICPSCGKPINGEEKN